MPPPIRPRRSIPLKAIGDVFRTLSRRQSNWLLCDGSSYSTEQYPELAEVLSMYELEPGVLPDCRPRYRDEPVAASPGRTVEGFGTYIPTYIVASSAGKPVSD